MLKPKTKKSNRKKCPVCNSNEFVVPIRYGEPIEMPGPDSDFAIGGCIITFNQPRWYCKKDELEFK